MIKIQGLRLRPGEQESHLMEKARRELGTEIKGFKVLRRSVDARKKPEVWLVYTIAVMTENEERVLKRCRSKQVSQYTETKYSFPYQRLRLANRPVVVGTGPAGLFCALMLARIGAQPILLERGKNVDERAEDVSHFWNTGILDTESNVQFGEGGAGTFSDGKLNTGVNDPRMRMILEEFVKHGAPASILIDSAPHIGTDYLRTVVINIRNEIISLGGEIRFQHKMVGLISAQGMISGILVRADDKTYSLDTHHLVLAIGHSARDTFEMLLENEIPMEQKRFAVGVRIEHAQKDITKAQYGAEITGLPASSYKLACHPETGRGVFSFCVCPGGIVVGAASETGHVCTNGMSDYARNGSNINGGLLVSVGPEDFGTDHPLAGMYYQRRLEKAAFQLGGGNYHAPAQKVGDFLRNVPSFGPGRIVPTYQPGVVWTNLHACLPEEITQSLELAIPILGKKLHGFDDPDAVLIAVESRSSSPVRIVRDESGQSAVKGLFPCGEGAGYAGGIMSASADGIRTAEFICRSV